MLKRTIEISENAAHLSVRMGQLQLSRSDEMVGTVPCEDIGVVVVDHPQVTYTHSALVELSNTGSVVVLCGKNHQPAAMVLPVSNHTLVVSRLAGQINMSQPTKKRLWQQIVRSKINRQADLLEPGGAPERRLRRFREEVHSGDTTNREAQAAKTYWAHWLNNWEKRDLAEEFRRDPDGDRLNGILNYGYAIVRAAVARSIVAAGLTPALGIHHCNRSNAFCLADDLMEPFRPLVDEVTRELAFRGETWLTREVKSVLLRLLTVEVQSSGGKGPLFVALHRYITSFVRVSEMQASKLEIPKPCESAVTEVCGS